MIGVSGREAKKPRGVAVHLEGAMHDGRLQLEVKAGIHVIVSEVILLQHRVVEATG